ncbi:MAG: hypothetical protein Q7R54_03225 [bacterium]|nr:hypothetical protein [bacterium]
MKKGGLKLIKDSSVADAYQSYIDLQIKYKQEIQNARKKCADLCYLEMRKATSLSEAITAFELMVIDSWYSSAMGQVLTSWVEHCNSIEELQKLYKASAYWHSYKNPALIKWNDLCSGLVPTKSTQEELLQLFWLAPEVERSDLQEEAIPARYEIWDKLVTLLTTRKEMDEIWFGESSGNPMTKILGLREEWSWGYSYRAVFRERMDSLKYE